MPAPLRPRAASTALTLLVASLGFPLPARAVDPTPVVRKAAEEQRETERKAGRLAYERTEVQVELGSDGTREKTERKLFTVVSDGPDVVLRELVAVDGRPAAEDEKERARRENEKRQRRWEESRGNGGDDSDELMSGRLPLLDLLGRLQFHYAGEVVVDGRPTYLVEFEPKPGLVSHGIRDRVLNNFAGRAWIDAAEGQVTRIDGHLTKEVKVLGGAALDISSVRIVYEGHAALPGLWAPCREEIRISARAGFFLAFNREFRFEFANYRRLGREPTEAAMAAAWPSQVSGRSSAEARGTRR